MAKALKPLIIVLFILSIVSVVLGSMLFGKREILKDSVKKMVDGHVAVARNIEYKKLNSASLANYETMDAELSGIKQAAKNKQTDLVQTKGELETTAKDLDDTKDTLQVTRTELQETEEEVVELQTEVEDKNEEIADKSSTIADLNSEKTNLQGQIVDLEVDLAAKEDELTDWKADYAKLQEDYDDIFEEIRSHQQSGTTGAPADIMDIRGKVLVVDSQWGFVIIDKGRNEELQPNVVFIVHRDQEPVGKIRVKKVEDNLSIAEISHTWDGQAFSEGDEYIPPRSTVAL